VTARTAVLDAVQRSNQRLLALQQHKISLVIAQDDLAVRVVEISERIENEQAIAEDLAVAAAMLEPEFLNLEVAE